MSICQQIVQKVNDSGLYSLRYSDIFFYQTPSAKDEEGPYGVLKRNTSDIFDIFLYPEGYQWCLELPLDEVRDIASGKSKVITVYECPSTKCKAAYSRPEQACIRCEPHRFKRIEQLDTAEALKIAEFFGQDKPVSPFKKAVGFVAYLAFYGGGLLCLIYMLSKARS